MKKYYIISGVEQVKITGANKIDGVCGVMLAFSKLTADSER